jgi:hypothetical protein
MIIDFLKKVLTDDSLFQQVIDAEDKIQAIKTIEPSINLEELFSPIPQVAPNKLWQIFSRIRFEYVRPVKFKYIPATCVVSMEKMPRIFPFMPENDLKIGLKSYFLESLNPKQENVALFQRFSECAHGTVGKSFYEYYKINNGLDAIVKPSMFPSSYILVHDFHHLLLNVPPSVQGELEVLAFEEGMVNRTQPPILLLEQLQIFLESQGHKLFETERLCKAWNIGANCQQGIFDDFPLLNFIDKDLEETRKELGVFKLN